MEVRNHHRTQRSRRTAGPLLSLSLIFCTVFGALAGPGTLAAREGRPAPLLQQVTLTKSEESDFSHDGYASYGEVITYTLRYEVPAGTTLTNTQLEDVFDNLNNQNLRVSFVDYVGPIPIGSTPPAPPVITFTVTPRDGRPVLQWELGTYNNTSGTTWTYEIRYHVRVYWDSNNNTARQARNRASLDWQEGGPVSTPDVVVTLVQPASISFEKSQIPNPNVELDPGAWVTWTLRFRNDSGPGRGTAYDVRITDTMPTQLEFQSVFPVTATYIVIGDKVIFTRDSLVTSTEYTSYGIKATVPLTNNVAHNRIYNEGKFFCTSAPGDVPGERQYPNIPIRSTTAYLRNISAGKSQVSPYYGSYNTIRQAVAGEPLTITIAMTVPQGIVLYNPILRVFLQDGLTFTHPISPDVQPDWCRSSSCYDPWRPGDNYLQLTWDLGHSITNTQSGPVSVRYVFGARALQKYWLQQVGTDVPHNTNLNIVVQARWSDAPDAPVNPQNQYLRYRNDTCDSQNVGCVKFIRPNLRYENQNSGSRITYSFPEGFVGGATISYTLNLRNRSGTPAYPPAHEVVLTDTLSPNLTYLNATPVPDWVETGPYGTRLHWDLGPGNPIMPPPDREIFTIWATLPSEVVAGMPFTSTAQADYTTFEGSPPDGEGHYLDEPYTAQAVARGGVAAAKYVVPADNVRIGDLVTYTVRITLNQGLVMWTPTLVDKLPIGFHFTGTMTIENGTIVTGPVQMPLPSDPRYERLSWGLDTIDNRDGSQPKSVTIRYHALLTGWDSRTPPQRAYASSRGDLVNKQNARNELSACWPAAQGSPTRYCLGTPLPYAETKVCQPYLADTFDKLRPEIPKRDYEVNNWVQFRIPLKNTGKARAYEINIQDMLPPGVVIENWSLTDLNPPDPNIGFLSTPVQGQTGAISWVLNYLSPDQSVNLTYNGKIISSVAPGDLLTNTATIVDYSSLPGELGNKERHYKDLDGAFSQDPIPVPQDGPWFRALGVSITKSDMLDPVNPNQVLTYTLFFGNSSQVYDATNVRITDTYDAHLSFVNYTTNRGDMTFQHDPVNRRLVWTVPSLPKNGSLTDWWIRPYFTLVLPMDQSAGMLVNTAAINGQGDLVNQVVRTETTEVNLPFLSIVKTGTPGTVAPGQTLVYTLNFQNSGQFQANGVAIQEYYDPLVDFVSASPAPYSGTDDLWYWTPLAPSQGESIQVTVQVHRPVPAGVEKLTNRASIDCDEVYAVSSLPFETGLLVPKLVIDIADSPDPVDLGQQITYQITATNQGVAASSVVLTNTLDAYTQFNTANPWPVNNCLGGVCIFNLGAMAQGEQRLITLWVTVASEIPPGIVRLTDRARIGSWEITPGDVETVEYTTILGRAGHNLYLPLVMKADSGL